MKKLILLFTLPLVLLADSIVLSSHEIDIKGNTYWFIEACKDGYIYTLIKDEPVNIHTLTKEFDAITKSTGVKCFTDFKSKEQLTKCR